MSKKSKFINRHGDTVEHTEVMSVQGACVREISGGCFGFAVADITANKDFLDQIARLTRDGLLVKVTVALVDD